MSAPHEHLKAWRLHLRMSQDALAKLAGADRSYLSKVESGKAVYTVRFLTRAAVALGVDLNEMLSRMPGSDTEDLLRVWDDIAVDDRGEALEMLRNFAGATRGLAVNKP